MFLKVLKLKRHVHQKSVFFCHYWCFSDKRFRFQTTVGNDCNNALMSIAITNIAILNIHGLDYPCTVFRISKSEAMYIFRNCDLTENSLSLQGIIFFFLIIKINNKTTCYT